jgi:tetratricopeptide (TPR) repeat protein
MLAGGAMLGIAGGLFGIQQVGVRQRVARCVALGQTVDTVWNDAARGRVTAGIESSGVGHASETAARTLPWLDRWAAQWTEVREQTCRHHRVDETWDDNLRARADECLDERLGHLTALVDQLAQTDAAAARRVVSAAASLPSPDLCGSPDELRRRAPLPEGGLDEVRAVRELLSRAGAASSAARYADARTLAEDGLQQAQALGFAPLMAEARVTLAAILRKLGEYDEGEMLLIAAYDDASTAGALEAAADAAVQLVFLVGDRKGRHDEALVWGHAARAAVARVELQDGLRLAGLLNAEASVHWNAGRYDEAREGFERALAIKRDELGDDHPKVATAMNNLAETLRASGKPREAVALHQEALELRRRTLGENHPDVAQSLNNLGGAHYRLDELDEARARFEQALAIREASLNPDHPHIAESLSNLSSVLRAGGQLEEARALTEKALEIQKKALGPDHPHVAANLVNLSVILDLLGQPERAEKLLREALEIQKETLGPAHPQVISTLNNLAHLALKAGRVDVARDLYASALAATGETFGEDHDRLVGPLSGLARAALAGGDPKGAVEFAERALTIATADDARPRTRAEMRFLLARVLWAARTDRARARELARQARADLKPLEEVEDVAELAQSVDAWLRDHGE